MTETKKSLLKSYLYSHRLSISAFVAFSLIFFIVFLLYDITLKAIWYPTLICGVIGIITIVYDFLKYKSYHKRLCDVEKDITMIAEHLPPPITVTDDDYQHMIRCLSETRLAEFNKYTEKKTEMLDYYSSWVHQIKAPIAVMHALLQCNDTPEYKSLSNELFRIEQYVEMVLCYARLGDGASDLLIKEYNLDEIITASIRKFAAQFVHNHIKLNYKKTNITILIDRKWLQFIIEQLLSNAIKYTESGTITISVDENEKLTISDTGIGIAQEDLPRIFEKGFTGYNGRQNLKSTGLGLYLCKSAANLINCKLLAESEIRKGSSFTIDLHKDKLETE